MNNTTTENQEDEQAVSSTQRINKEILQNAKKFWKIVVDKNNLKCPYTGKPIIEDYSIDHFIPWSFVTHDLLWNLVPVLNRSVNSSKSDNLPSFDKYFSNFSYVIVSASYPATLCMTSSISSSVFYLVSKGKRFCKIFVKIR